MTRLLAILFGIAFIFFGVAGFLPIFVQDGMLFGFFTATGMHNIIHIATGVIAIMAATSDRYARYYFQIVGLLYTVIAIWGFWSGGDLYIMQVQQADNILHIVIGVIALLIGFHQRKDS